MTKPSTLAEREAPAEELSLYFSPLGEAWRVHISPQWIPRYLRPFFDRNSEASPVYVDFEDLARHMQSSDAQFEKRVNRAGGVEVLARGEAAEALAVWLSTAFSTGVRLNTGPT